METERDAGPGVLAGVKVLDLSAYVAGPYGCTLLADLGADVVKVEPPQGDNLRNYPSTLEGECRFFVGANRGKRSVVLDLKHPDGLELLLSLADDADVLVHNFRSGVAERLGIGWETLRLRNPRLVYASLSGYGETGPMRETAGFDQVLQTMTGITVGQADPGAPPQLVHGSVVDYYAASLLALGVTGALYERERTGSGQRVTTSLLASALSMQSGRFVWGPGETAQTDRNLRSTGVNGLYATRDGYVYLQATTTHFWQTLCRLIGCDDLAEDPELDTVRKRTARAAEIGARIGRALAHRTTEEWRTILAPHVPFAVASGIEAMFDHPQVIDQGLVAEYAHATLGRYRGFRGPIAFDGALGRPRASPALGEHTDEVLHEAGLSAERIAALRAAGAIG